MTQPGYDPQCRYQVKSFQCPDYSLVLESWSAVNQSTVSSWGPVLKTHLLLTKEYMSSLSSMNRFHSGFSPWRSRYMSLDTMTPSDSKPCLTMKQSSLQTTRLPATRLEGVNTKIFLLSRSRRMCWSVNPTQRRSLDVTARIYWQMI